MQKIFEEYVESADYKISVFFKELKSQIERWFTDGSLAAQGCEIDGAIDIVNYNPMEKFLIFNFVEPISEAEEVEESGSIFKYRVIFMVRLDEMKGSSNAQPTPAQGEVASAAIIPVEGKSLEINKILLKIHQFDENMDEKGELVEEVAVEDIKEDFIIDKIGQLKDKSGDDDVDGNDLKDNVYIK